MNKQTNSAGHIRVHSVLYGNDPERIRQTVAHLNRAADLAIAKGSANSVSLTYGDSSPKPILGDDAVEEFKSSYPALKKIETVFFDGNLGSACGHNRLLEHTEEQIKIGETLCDSVLIMNPDVMLAPDALIELSRPLQNATTGLVEARQLPIEHPKEYNAVTGETDWATTACALIPLRVIRELEGFDSEAFFLYCDDVDFSWRARLAGYKLVYQPSAVVFHDKRLGNGGKWDPAPSEQYFSAEAALFMAHKYSRPDIVEKLVKHFESSSLAHLNKAAAHFKDRKNQGRLPEPIDKKGKVSKFVGDFYTEHRFSL
ncbi:glycosyltransferase family 2 protein [Xanthomonas euvesicatoria]|uniref:glycosyltransferase family 2 protein n=1 Tax=Xanthomonas euvesicatoria TaxID=456327 RepID=UPI002405E5F7|nr:glycosyltransferase family 2 protein [Xanthomonas euvesicatoria]MCP3043458.1 glycosyltransferase family 2 protein [Xanthomonas euvesicatoria pv. allii]